MKAKRGRPRRLGPAPLKDGAVVSSWLTRADFDALYKAAQVKDVSLSALVRDWLQSRIKSS